MKLHEAIVQVLTTRGASNSTAIANAINEQQLYVRKDGKPVPPSQISARINNYPELFSVEIGGLYQLKSRISSNSEDYANLFHKIGDILHDSVYFNTPIKKANLVLWFAELLWIRTLVIQHPKAIDHSIAEFLSSTLSILDPSKPLEALEALKYLSANHSKSIQSLDKNFAQKLINFLNNQSMSRISFVLSQFSFEFGSEHKIVAAARAYLNASQHSKLQEPPVSAYLKQLVAILYNYKGERSTELNLFTGTTPMVPAIPPASSRKTFLQTYSEDVAVFLSLCHEHYAQIFRSRPLDLLKNETLEIQNFRFQSIFAILPLGNRVLENTLVKYPSVAKYGSKSELVYIELITQLLAPKGIAFVVVPESILSSTGNSEVALRSKLLESDSVEAVISLPKVLLPYSSINLSLLLLNNAKDTEDKGRVYFIDTLANFDDKNSSIGIHPEDVLELISNKAQGNSFKAVSISTLIEANCNLRPLNYISPVENELRNLIAHDITVSPLSELLKEVKVPSQSNSALLPFVKITHLRNSETEFLIEEANLAAIEPSPQSGSIVEGRMLLAAKVGENLKPTILDLKESKVCLSNNVASFRIDETKVLPDFLLSELHSDFFKKQFASILSGAAQSSWKPKDLLRLLVRVPSMEQQQLAQREKLQVLHRLKQSEADKLKAKLQYKETEYSIVSSVRHSLASQFGGFRTDISLLKQFLSKVIEKGEQITWETPLTPYTNLADIFKRMDAKILDAQITFDKIKGLIELNRRELNFERTDIVLFINECLTEFNYRSSDVEFIIATGTRKDLPLFAEIDRFLIKELFRNLVENSIRHGKKDGEILRGTILVNGNPSSQNMFTIDYSDFGKGLPEGFSYEDYLAFGKRSGNNQGSGIGGYMVSQIIELHSGKIIPHDKSKMTSNFGLLMSFPFNQTIE